MARWHSLWTTSELAPDVEQELNIERLMAVSRHQPLASAAHAGISLALALGVRATIPTALWLLLALFQVAAIMQARVWWIHRRQPRPRRVSNATITRLILWSVMWGLLWGTYSAWLLSIATLHDAAIIGIGIMGMAAGGVAMLTTVPAAAVFFLAFSLMPATAVAFWFEDPVNPLLGLFLVAAAVFMTGSVRQNYAIFLDHLRLRLLTAELSAETAEANQAKVRFLSNMGHELRTPLNAVIGFAEMIAGEMKGKIGEPAYLEFARNIVQSARHLSGTIDDILDLSRFQAGEDNTLRDSVVPAGVLLEHVLAAIKPICDRSGVTLNSDIELLLPEIRVDVGRTHQVLMGMLSHAIGCSAAGDAVFLKAFIVRWADDGRLRGLVLRVNAPGNVISASELARILQPFRWTREAEYHQMPGAGLKLPLMDRIVSAHGGKFEVISTVERGTTITVTLPPERIVGYRSSEPGGYMPSIAPIP
jgi:signal transduction histidine kinase